MAGLGLSSYKGRRQFSHEAAYSHIELKKLGRTVLVQYHVCCSNIPCVRVFGYIQERSATRLNGGLELLDQPHLPANLKPIPEQHRWVIRRCIMADIAARFNIDAPLVHFE
jgi:hypothetical protein